MPADAEHYFGPSRSALRCVARQIVLADVGFGFDDSRAIFLAADFSHENFADQIVRKIAGRLLKKRARHLVWRGFTIHRNIRTTPPLYEQKGNTMKFAICTIVLLAFTSIT